MRDRWYSTCGLIIGKDGQPVVAIIGGYDSDQKGMEIWDPIAKTIELLWDEIPPEEGGTQGLQASEMVILNGGQEFLIYGGYQGSTQDGIWKYNGIDNTWKRYSSSSIQLNLQNHILHTHFRIGGLLSKRAYHVTLPVFDIECQ